jgi:uncharacterized repeat protein (TIGR03847 family)
MADIIEFDPVDTLSAGAFGVPGDRTFIIQARKGSAVLSVLVEKEQVALLSAEAEQFLERLDDEYPEQVPPISPLEAPVAEAVPLFRARLIGLGFDPERELVLLELREAAVEEEGEAPPSLEESDGHVARLYASRAQLRAMARVGAEAVSGGRPPCPLCDRPMDPSGHICPRWN